MTTIEEQIWDYIDGNCTAEEKLAIETRIIADEAYSALYLELSEVHQHLGAIELDEPPMAFNRNVMNLVDLEIAPVSLKTKVDRRIIYGIAAFFILALCAIFGYALSQVQFKVSTVHMNLPSMNIDFTRYLTPTFIKIFVFTDLLLGFLYLDGFLRRKKDMS